MSDPFVSVIVPVLNDAVQLDGLLLSLHLDQDVQDVEIIVANGAAVDSTIQGLRSQFPDVLWTDGTPGRGRQMNQGSAHAKGRWLLFLHADARLSPGWVDEIRRADGAARYVGGCFRFSLDAPETPARLIEWGVAWRVRWLGLPYGDQAIFVRRAVFDALGGYRPLPLLEDVEFVQRLRRVGRLMHSDLAVRVSARRWKRDGWVRRSAENMMLVLLFLAGVAPDRLARVYHRGPPRPRKPNGGEPNPQPRVPSS